VFLKLIIMHCNDDIRSPHGGQFSVYKRMRKFTKLRRGVESGKYLVYGSPADNEYLFLVCMAIIQSIFHAAQVPEEKLLAVIQNTFYTDHWPEIWGNSLGVGVHAFAADDMDTN